MHKQELMTHAEPPRYSTWESCPVFAIWISPRVNSRSNRGFLAFWTVYFFVVILHFGKVFSEPSVPWLSRERKTLSIFLFSYLTKLSIGFDCRSSSDLLMRVNYLRKEKWHKWFINFDPIDNVILKFLIYFMRFIYFNSIYNVVHEFLIYLM